MDALQQLQAQLTIANAQKLIQDTQYSLMTAQANARIADIQAKILLLQPQPAATTAGTVKG